MPRRRRDGLPYCSWSPPPVFVRRVIGCGPLVGRFFYRFIRGIRVAIIGELSLCQNVLKRLYDTRCSVSLVCETIDDLGDGIIQLLKQSLLIFRFLTHQKSS
ncbi:hypothetical protein CFBP5473_24760 (plasmid) [Agrobacterium larrymoorei]|uniref:Uncharacterized protein n=1 Tax=Agrobacterium larrymoorei TaxID=160699 RepID=A0A4D7DVP1_9HYPH|nr:hypothetical protein CFBP5473_24760 [Agrobacterium larrymoorei]